MKVSISENPQLVELEVAIVCARIDNHVQRIAASLNAFDRKIIGKHNGATFIVPAQKVLYVEAVDGATFLYTCDTVLETPLRLYEIEDKLAETEFMRVSKQLLVNFDHVKSLKPFANARLQMILDNDEVIIASRQYAPAIKHKIGL